jgi:hypothetical protein
LDSVKFRKLKDYVNILVRQGDSYEKESDLSGAIQKFLKVVDVLLVMADIAPSYPDWLECVNKAQAFQKKIKSLLALASIEREREEGRGKGGEGEESRLKKGADDKQPLASFTPTVAAPSTPSMGSTAS